MNSHPHNEALQRLDEWMRAYGSDVINFAFSYVKDYHVAQDISQDVFLKAFSKIDSFRGDSSPKTWLLSITANRCKDHLRSWTVRHVVHEEETIVEKPDVADTERDVQQRLERDALWVAVAQLPVKYREVIVLYYQRDLSGQEIAQILGTSEQSIRTRLHRGRTMLKQIMTEGGGDVHEGFERRP